MTAALDRRRGAGRWLKAAVSVTLLATLLAIVPWEEIRAGAARLPLGVWAAVLGGFIAGHALGVLKWC